MEDYKKKYKDALEELKKCNRFDCEPVITILKLFPELEESDYVIIRKIKDLITYFQTKGIDYSLCERIRAWLEKQGEQSEYNPYKATVKSITAMVEKYAHPNSDLQDFYNNIKIKCKDAVEYDKTFIEKQGEQKPAWSEEDERYYDSALWHIKNSCGKEGNVYNWLKSLKERVKGE